MGLWSSKHAATIDPDRFRAHDQYLDQNPSFPYRATVEHIRSRGLAGWIDLMGEDGAFGCVTAEIDGVMVSRDLLDSILEVAFLRDALGSKFFGRTRKCLDIGAGYGRLTHRMSRVYPACFVYCTDDIPVSQDVCRKYLAHRGMYHQLADWVVPKDRLEDLPPLDLAINVHSWSECTLDEVTWWIDWLRTHEVPRLFVLPHDPDFRTWNGPSYLPILRDAGYRIVQQWSGPECNVKHYYLFERS